LINFDYDLDSYVFSEKTCEIINNIEYKETKPVKYPGFPVFYEDEFSNKIDDQDKKPLQSLIQWRNEIINEGHVDASGIRLYKHYKKQIPNWNGFKRLLEHVNFLEQ